MLAARSYVGNFSTVTVNFTGVKVPVLFNVKQPRQDNVSAECTNTVFIYLWLRSGPVSTARVRTAVLRSAGGGGVSQDGGVSAERAARNMSAAGPPQEAAPVWSGPLRGLMVKVNGQGCNEHLVDRCAGK